VLKDMESLLCCPRTGNKLELDDSQTHYNVSGSSYTYPVNDGIIDFLPNERDRISRSYDLASRIYEPIITSSNKAVELFNSIVWGIKENLIYSNIVPDYIPPDFSGVILDVPVGTGVFTARKYAQLQNATILAADYSYKMLRLAKTRYTEYGLNNVIFLHADVSKLPIAPQVIDFVFSMNGLHAFTKKEKAIAEIYRILKPGGKFSGCSYIKGQRMLTDLIIRYVYTLLGVFSTPFYSLDEATETLNNTFTILESKHERSVFIFNTQR